MAKLADRVKVASATTGTGSFTLGAAESGYRDFTVFADGDVVEYAASEGTTWETGYGTLSSTRTVLSRTLRASSSGSLISFAGAQKVWCNAPAGILHNLTCLDKGNSSTSAQTFDYSAGNCQRLTVTGAHTINAVTNWPASGNLGELLIELINGAAFTITWPTINWVKSDGSVTTTFANNGVTLQTSGTDFLLLWTRDAGTTVYGKFAR